MRPIFAVPLLLLAACVTPSKTSDSSTTADSGNGGGDDTSSGGGFTPTTIADIQRGNVSVGSQVEITGAVVTTPVEDKTSGSGNTYEIFFVQDPAGGEYSGIFVYVPGSAGTFSDTVSQGSEVTIDATYTEYASSSDTSGYTLSELEVEGPNDITVTGTGTIPDPMVVDAATLGDLTNGEPYEGVLVEVDDVTVTTATNSYGEWQVDDAVWVDDAFEHVDASVGDSYSRIIGPLYYGYGKFMIEPRDANDLVSAR